MAGLLEYAHPMAPPRQSTPAAAAAARMVASLVTSISRASSHTPPDTAHSCVHDEPSAARIQSPAASGGRGTGGGGLAIQGAIGGGGTEGLSTVAHGQMRE